MPTPAVAAESENFSIAFILAFCPNRIRNWRSISILRIAAVSASTSSGPTSKAETWSVKISAVPPTSVATIA